MNGPLGAGLLGGLTVNYDYTEYQFSSPTAFGQVAPWTDVRRLGVSAQLLFRGSGPWSFLASPSVDSFMEDGADWGDALTYGAVFAAARSFGPDRRIGLGVSVFQRLEEVTVLPLVFVEWRLTDRLRITNPLRAGPTGGAGLELSYELGGWTLGAGGAYRNTRFRLRDDGPFPNGVGEERAIPAFVHAGGRLGQHFAVDLYAGALLGGQLRVEDSSGGKLAAQDFDPAPLLGATVSARF